MVRKGVDEAGRHCPPAAGPSFRRCNCGKREIREGVQAYGEDGGSQTRRRLMRPQDKGSLYLRSSPAHVVSYDAVLKTGSTGARMTFCPHSWAVLTVLMIGTLGGCGPEPEQQKRSTALPADTAAEPKPCVSPFLTKALVDSLKNALEWEFEMEKEEHREHAAHSEARYRFRSRQPYEIREEGRVYLSFGLSIYTYRTDLAASEAMKGLREWYGPLPEGFDYSQPHVSKLHDYFAQVGPTVYCLHAACLFSPENFGKLVAKMHEVTAHAETSLLCYCGMRCNGSTGAAMPSQAP